MAITKDHAIGGAAIAVAMTLGATVMHAVSGPGAAPVTAASTIASQSPPPPPCKQACESLAAACPRTKGAGNCEAFLSAYASRLAAQQTEPGAFGMPVPKADAGPTWTCSQPITDDVLRGLDLQDCVGGP